MCALFVQCLLVERGGREGGSPGYDASENAEGRTRIMATEAGRRFIRLIGCGLSTTMLLWVIHFLSSLMASVRRSAVRITCCHTPA